MIENLRLEAEHTRGDYYESLAQGYGGTPGVYGSFVGLANPEDYYFRDSTAPNSIYKSDGTFSTYDPLTNPVTLEDIGTTDSPGYRMPRYRNTNTSSPATNPTSGNTNIYSYGNYYSWAAAMANTTYYNSYSGDTGSDAANTSICPSGWRLPLGINRNTTNLSFSKLDYDMGGTGDSQSDTSGTTQSKKWRSFPNNFLYSGYAHLSPLYSRGSYGYYWSSSSGGNYSSSLLLSDSRLRPGTNGNANFDGFTVRCVLAP